VVELNAADFADWHHSFADYHQHPELAAAMLPYVYFQEDGSPVNGPAIGAAHGAVPAMSTASQVKIAPPAKPPEAALESDSSSEEQRTGEDRREEPAVPEPPRNPFDLRIEP
jgi:hypothetical protein